MPSPRLLDPSHLSPLMNRLTGLDGPVIAPSDPGYDEARAVWNGMIDLRPAAIVRPRTARAVATAIRAARELDLPIAVRGGGHNVAGLGTIDGGLLIDLAAMTSVQVEPERRMARVGGGARWGDVDRATQAFGLATPGGVVSDTGVGGLTLGGGFGWLRRKHGLSADNLVAAEVVTADGRIVRASEEEHPELLWGLRGGGGNFGVVTSFEFRLHPVGPNVAFAIVLYPIEQAARVLRGHEAFVSAEPGDISTLAVLGHVPETPDYPGEVHGRPMVGVLAMHAGDPSTGEGALAPLKALGEPMADLGGVMPYVAAQQVYDADYPRGHRYYWKSANLAALTEGAIEVLVRHALAAPSHESTIDLWLHGGAVTAVPPDATAFGRRDVAYLVSPEANWPSPDDDQVNIAWSRGLLAELAEHGTQGSYLNFPGMLEEGDALVRSSLASTYERLAALKQEFDPDNVFRRNQNIPPADA